MDDFCSKNRVENWGFLVENGDFYSKTWDFWLKLFRKMRTFGRKLGFLVEKLFCVKNWTLVENWDFWSKNCFGVENYFSRSQKIDFSTPNSFFDLTWVEKMAKTKNVAIGKMSVNQ